VPDEDLRRLERAAATDPSAWAKLRAERARREKFERFVRAVPAHDDLRGGSGVHGLDLNFELRGPLGAVSLNVFTGWCAPPKNEVLNPDVESLHSPIAVGIAIHHPTRVEGLLESDVCEVLGGSRCWVDIASLQGRQVFQALVRDGHEAMWQRLEETYARNFEAPASSAAKGSDDA
jgi:hypothetical protein